MFYVGFVGEGEEEERREAGHEEEPVLDYCQRSG